MGLPNRDELKENGTRQKVRQKKLSAEPLMTKNSRPRVEAEHAGGKVEEGFGKARRKVGEAIEDVGDAIKR